MLGAHVLTVEEHQAVNAFEESEILLVEQSSPLKRSSVQCLTAGTMAELCSHRLAIDCILNSPTHACGYVFDLKLFVLARGYVRHIGLPDIGVLHATTRNDHC